MALPILGILSAAAQIVPSIAGWIGGDKAEEVAQKVANVATGLTGENDPMKAMEMVLADRDFALKFERETNSFLADIQQELTRRHKYDMQSDSWLSKNIRPICLLFTTLAITVGVYLPVEYVDATKFKALTDMGVYIYGYYFIGRSTEKTGGLEALASAFRK